MRPCWPSTVPQQPQVRTDCLLACFFTELGIPDRGGFSVAVMCTSCNAENRQQSCCTCYAPHYSHISLRNCCLQGATSRRSRGRGWPPWRTCCCCICSCCRALPTATVAARTWRSWRRRDDDAKVCWRPVAVRSSKRYSMAGDATADSRTVRMCGHTTNEGSIYFVAVTAR